MDTRIRKLVWIWLALMLLLGGYKPEQPTVSAAQTAFTEIARVNTQGVYALDLAWSPDSKLIGLISANNVLEVWNTENMSVSFSGNSDTQYLGLAWSPDGNSLALGSVDGVEILDVDNPENSVVLDYQVTLDLGNDIVYMPSVRGLAWSPDGLMLATGGEVGEIKIWNTENWRVTRILEAGVHEAFVNIPDQPSTATYHGSVYGVKWSPNGKYFFSISDRGGFVSQLEVWDASSGERVLLQILRGSADWSPDGQKLATAEGEFVVIRNEMWETELSIEVWNGRQLIWSPDGRYLAHFLVEDELIAIIDADSGALLTILELGSSHIRMQWSPDGQFLATALENGDLVIWEWHGIDN